MASDSSVSSMVERCGDWTHMIHVFACIINKEFGHMVCATTINKKYNSTENYANLISNKFDCFDLDIQIR